MTLRFAADEKSDLQFGPRKDLPEVTWRHPNRATHRRKHLLQSYGLTLDQYDQLCAAQGKVCAICKTSAETASTVGRLYVDHCHTTGKVRGLLCRACNTGLGQFRDNPELLSKAITYLEPSK